MATEILTTLVEFPRVVAAGNGAINTVAWGRSGRRTGELTVDQVTSKPGIGAATALRTVCGWWAATDRFAWRTPLTPLPLHYTCAHEGCAPHSPLGFPPPSQGTVVTAAAPNKKRGNWGVKKRQSYYTSLYTITRVTPISKQNCFDSPRSRRLCAVFALFALFAQPRTPPPKG